MSQVDCVNFLAFIQIAVAFDFGLLCLHGSHLFKDLHRDFLVGFRSNTAGTADSANAILTELKYKQGINIKVRKELLRRWVNRLTYLTDTQQANWSKYVYVGLCGGLYALLALLLIGMSGSAHDPMLRDFLLVSGEVFFVYEFIIVYQIGKIRTNRISIVTLIKKSIFLIAVLALVWIFTFNGWYFKYFSNFHIPFIVLLFAIVYFPVFVYVWKMWDLKREIAKAKMECEKAVGKASDAP